ncbi:hypothetical protein ACIQ2D_10100 [Lysinibacillus sp. NPDC097287]|uniref:hypothetical protein n=1 Tax=Lysinibacillus sp. NPDC097287 TaxID=3364144 RepID=UPI0038068448
MKKRAFLGLIFLIIMLMGCTSNESLEPEYEGRSLHIAVIGEIPKVREDNINFEDVNFDNWTINNYDSIFISEAKLSEAAKQENV